MLLHFINILDIYLNTQRGKVMHKKNKDAILGNVSVNPKTFFNNTHNHLVEIDKLEDLVAQSTKELIRMQHLLLASLNSPKDVIILAIDHHFNYLFFNDAHRAVMKFAYDIDVEIGMNLLDCITSDIDKKHAKENYDLAITGVSHTTVQEFGNQNIRYYESFYNPFYDENDEILGATVFAKDITERFELQRRIKESEERFETLFNKAPMGYQSLDARGCFLAVNQKWLDILGYTAEEVVGRWFGDYLVESSRNSFKERFEQFKRQGKIKSEFEMIQKSGKKIHVEFDGMIGYDEHHEFLQTHCTLVDVTVQRRAERKLKESEEKYRLLYSSMNQGLALHQIILNQEGEPIDYTFISVNESYEKITGLKSEDIIGKRVKEVMPQIEDDWIKSYGRVAITGQPISYEKYSSEMKRYFSITAYCPRIGQFAVLVSDITDRKVEEERIVYIGNHDYLTDLFNRRYFILTYEQFCSIAYYPLSVMMIDINGLKLINDAYGHANGDKAIQMVANLLKNSFDRTDIIARIGGDEFAVLSPNKNGEQMQFLKEKIVQGANDIVIGNIVISLAIGYETVNDKLKSIEEILASAENYLYRHKLTVGMSVRNHAIKAILNTLTDKYIEEKIHSERVSQFCKEIGSALGIQKDDLAILELAGMYHDIGKISIPDAILNKPGKLTFEEFETIKTHTQIGYQILKAADEYSGLAEFALSHHERWDGKGYPRGLKETEIPLFSRIICIADSFEAMTANRPYRKGMSVEDAILEMIRCSGTQFDPEITKIFIEQILSKPTNREQIV